MIGLGAMGLPMSRNMVLRGQDVVGFDLAPERVLTAAEVGLTSAGSLEALMAACDVVLACLPTDESMVALVHDLCGVRSGRSALGGHRHSQRP